VKLTSSARLVQIARAAAQRVDSWVNTLTNVGTATGKTNVSFVPNTNEMLSLVDCENLYNFDGVAARICDAVPANALRGGFTVATGDAAADTAVAAALKGLNATALLTRAWTWGRTYGGGALYLGIDDGLAPAEPVDEARIRSLRWMVDVDRRDLYPMIYDIDPDSPRFGQPETYRLTRMGGSATETLTVHHTRIVRFEGITPTRRRRLVLQGWGESVLQRAYAEMQAMRGAFAAAGVLIQEASQGVLKIKDLMDMMASDTDDTMRRRLMLMDESRSIARSLLLDADGESYERVETGALTGVADIMDRMVLLLSAVTGIPVTILMGKSPAGLNATGESDIRAWYDTIAADREAMLTPHVDSIVRLLLLSREGPTGGKVLDVKVKYPSLWQPTQSEEEDLRSKVATRDVAYIQAGVLTPEEVAVSRFRQEGWSAETTVDLDARQAALEADAAATTEVAGQGAAPPGTDHAEGAAAIVAKVAARVLPRDAGVALLVTSLGLAPDDADRVMGEAGRTFFTAPEPGHAAAMDAMKADLAKAQASLRGHQAYTARLIQRAKDGGLELGAFTAREPTEVAEGDELAPGDVVAVPADGSEEPPPEAP